MVGAEKKEKKLFEPNEMSRNRRASYGSGCVPSCSPVLAVTAVVSVLMILFRPEAFPVFPAAVFVRLFCAAAFLLGLSCVLPRLCARMRPARKGARALSACCSGFSAGRPLFAAATLGVLLAGTGVYRVHLDSAMPVTLAAPGKVTAVRAVLSGDPLPWGQRYYRAEAETLEFFYSDGSRFSARGALTLCLPAEAVRAALPAQTARGHRRIYVCEGLDLVCAGSFAADKKPGEEICFYASEILEARPKDSPAGKILAWRGLARLSFVKAVCGWGGAGGFFLALASGIRDFMDESVSGIFRLSGLSHVLALSGMHLGILGGAVLFVGGKVGGKRFAVRVSLLALVFFLFFAGYSPSLFRACLFSLSLALVRRLGLPLRFLPVLAAVFCLHVLLKPADIYSVSFQLSYLATAGIFSAGDFFKETLSGILPGKLCPSVAVSLGAQFAVFPVSMSVFGMFAPVGIAAGLVLSLPVSFFLISGFCCVMLSSLVPPLYRLCGAFLDVQYRLIYGTADFFSRFPLWTATASPLYAPGPMCILYAALLLGGNCALRALRVRRMRGVDFSGL